MYLGYIGNFAKQQTGVTQDVTLNITSRFFQIWSGIHETIFHMINNLIMTNTNSIQKIIQKLTIQLEMADDLFKNKNLINRCRPKCIANDIR